MSDSQLFLAQLKELSSNLLIDLAALCKDIDAPSQSEDEYRHDKNLIRRDRLLMEERRDRVQKSRKIRDAIVELRRFGSSDNASQDNGQV